MTSSNPLARSLARDRVLDAAEALFMARGYAGVRLADIADSLGVKQASLYYHAPGGKADLYLAVMRRHLGFRHAGLAGVIAEGAPDIVASIRRILLWSVRQPPLNAQRFFTSDVLELAPGDAEALSAEVLVATWVPIAQLFTAAQQRGEVRRDLDPELLTGMVLSAADGMSVALQLGPMPAEALALQVADVLLHGVVPAPEGGLAQADGA